MLGQPQRSSWPPGSLSPFNCGEGRSSTRAVAHELLKVRIGGAAVEFRGGRARDTLDAAGAFVLFSSTANWEPGMMPGKGSKEGESHVQ